MLITPHCMKKCLSFSVFCLFTIGVLFSQSIKFSSEEVDLGIIPKGAYMSHRFEFKNDGDSDLIITKLSSLNETLLATSPTKAIAPGQTGIIEVSCKGENFGALYSTLMVTSNAKNGVITLRLRGEVL